MVSSERSPRPAPDTLGNSSGIPREIVRSTGTLSSGDNRRLLVPPEGRLLFRSDSKLEDTKPKELTATIKERLRISSLSQLPEELLSAGRAAIYFDTRQGVSSADRLSFFIYAMWHRSGSLNSVFELLGMSHERQRRLMMPVMEDEEKSQQYQEAFELLEATEILLGERASKIVPERLGEFSDRIGVLIEQGMSTDEIKADVKKLVIDWVEMENEKEKFVSEVERLAKKDILAKEIAPVLERSESEVKDVMRGLVVIGRLNPRKNSERTREFISLALKVEKYRKRKNNKLNNYQIAKKLGVSATRVRDAARVLIAVGRIEPFSFKEVQRMRMGTEDNKEKLRAVLEEAMSKGQRKVTMAELREKADLDYKGLDPVSALYHEIDTEQSVPAISSNSRARARQKLREIVVRGTTVLNLRQVSRDEDIPYTTLIRAYHDIENESGMPKLKQEVAADKKQKLRKRLLGYLSMHTDTFFNMKQASKDLGIGYTLSLHWYHEISETEAVPPIRPQGRRKLPDPVAA